MKRIRRNGNRKLHKSEKVRARKALRGQPQWLVTAVIALPQPRPREKGTFGAASDVRHIDPADYQDTTIERGER
jgi:hypothetical protein